MNVAITRAKHALFIVGDNIALKTNETWKHLFSDAKCRRRLLIAKNRRDVENMFLMNASQVAARYSFNGWQERKERLIRQQQLNQSAVPLNPVRPNNTQGSIPSQRTAQMIPKKISKGYVNL